MHAFICKPALPYNRQNPQNDGYLDNKSWCNHQNRTLEQCVVLYATVAYCTFTHTHTHTPTRCSYRWMLVCVDIFLAIFFLFTFNDFIYM